MEDKYIKGSRNNWDKIVITYEELETKCLKMLEEQIETLRIENRNLKGYHSVYSIPPVPSSYVPMSNCYFPCSDESTEETGDDD